MAHRFSVLDPRRPRIRDNEELEFVRPGRQLRNRQGEHRLDESDFGFRDTHYDRSRPKWSRTNIRCYRMAKTTTMSTQPKSSPSRVIDLVFTRQFRALRSDHSLRLANNVEQNGHHDCEMQRRGSPAVDRGRLYLSIRSPGAEQRQCRPFELPAHSGIQALFLPGGGGRKKARAEWGTGPFAHGRLGMSQKKVRRL
jgi:hypothetical protein